MESVNLLVVSEVGKDCLEKITGVSPRIKLTDVSGLRRGERSGDKAAIAKLDACLAEAEVVFGYRLPDNLISRAPKLKWVQIMSAGANRFLDAEMINSPVKLTGVSGIHATPIGEFILMQMLLLAKQAPAWMQLKQEKKWGLLPMSMVLRGQTVGIVGAGHIGGEAARLAKAFGMRVIGTRRSAKKEGRAKNVDIMLPAKDMPRLLKESDFVVLTVPLTSETKQLIGEKELRMMKPTAFIINIARGDVIDEPVLIRALKEHWIAGAAIDVTAIEPLPADSPLWEIPNLVLSPHLAGGMPDYNMRATEAFCENMKHYLAGKRMPTLVNKKLGY